jgi:hypothetical protein
LKQEGLAAKSVGYVILNARLMFKHKRELLEIIKPASMLRVELLLRVDMPKGIVINEQDEFSVNQVVPPMFNNWTIAYNSRS